MAVAYFQFHAPNGLSPLVNQGQPAVLYCFIWLYLSAAGPGPWSVDALRKK
jgi:putative oxidoreductase